MANWWESGRPFRVVVTRQVTEEEQVSMEALFDDYAEAETTAVKFARTCHRLMVEYNRKVVDAHRKQLDEINDKIAAKVMDLRQLESAIAEHDPDTLNGASQEH